MKKLTGMFAVCGLLVVLSSMATSAFAEEAAVLNIGGGFTAEESGFVLSKSAGDGRLVSANEIEPGKYIVTGEYKTEDMDALGKFATDIKTMDWKTSLSPYAWTCASPEWAPFVMYFFVDVKGQMFMRCGNWQNCKDTSKLHLRNLKIQPLVMTGDANMLVDGDFEQGNPGYLPTLWTPAGKESPAANYSLIKNTTFKTGKNVLCLASPKETAETILCTRAMHLPASGEIELTLWAKADKTSSMNMYIVMDGWGSYANKEVQALDTWKQYSATWTIPANDKKWFGVRLAMPKNQDCKIEIADVKIVWHAPAGSTSKPAAATTRPAAKADASK